MTDDELKVLVASVAENQHRIDEQMATNTEELTARFNRMADNQERIDAQIANSHATLQAAFDRVSQNQDRTDAQLAETDAQLAKTDAQLAKTDAQLAKTDAQLAKTDAQLAKTDAQLAKTGARLDKLAQLYGGVGNSLGAVAEEFYFNSLKANPVIGGVHFDQIDKNMTRTRDGIEDEFDLVLLNAEQIWVVEVKHKAHPQDLHSLLQNKAVNFRRLFPEYAGYEQQLALAAFHIADEVKQAALNAGVVVLQRKGSVFETIAA